MTNDLKIKDILLFFDVSPDILCIFGFDGTFKTLNPAFTRILGWTVDEAMQKPWLEFIHPDDLEKTVHAADELKQGIPKKSFRIRSMHKDGTYRLISWDSVSLEHEGLIFSVGRDVTELGQAEEFLSLTYHELEERVPERTSTLNVVNEQLTREIERSAQVEMELLEREARFQEAQKIAHVGSWDYDVPTNRLTWSDEIFRIFEVDQDKFGASYEAFLAMIHPDDRDSVDRAYVSSLQNKTPYEITHRLKLQDGRIKYVHEKAQTFYDDSGLPLRSVGTVQDITEQKRAEMSLAESEANLRSILDAVPGVMMLVKRGGTMLSVNRHFLEQLDVKEADCLGRSVFDFLPQEIRSPRRQWLEQIFTKGQAQELDDVRQGLQIHTYGFPVIDEHGEVDRVAIYGMDVTELNKAAESRELLAAVVEHGADSVVVTDTQGVIKYVNPTFERSSGYSHHEALGSRPSILKSGVHDEGYYKDIWSTITSGKVWKGRIVNRKKDGSFFEEDATISPIFNAKGEISDYVAVKRDVTKEVALQKQLSQSQKMEAIGTFAGGIAHDFNNIIFAIIGYTELALDTLPPESPTRKDLVQVLNASARAADMVRQILTFSRQGDEDRKPCDIGPLIKEGVKFLRASIPTTIEIVVTINSQLGTISANPTQIHQVLMNLCANAAHAMRETGGVLTIRLKRVHLDADFCMRHELGPAGHYICLEVADTGHGIPANIVQRVFEPYFTTKKVDEGTGMGLAVIHGIVKSHGGAITVKSTHGSGTTFEVFFPILDSQLAPERKGYGQDAQSGSESILLVDDEEIIVEMEEAMLKHLGYKVVSTRDAEKAVRILEGDPTGFDLVITDLTMPKMSGIELAAKMHKLRHDIPIILCTGYGRSLTESQIKQSFVSAVMSKPIRKKDLAHTVRMVLDSRE